MDRLLRIDPGITFDSPEIVFEQTYVNGGLGRTYDVSPDGERFLMITETKQTGTDTINLVLVGNWFEELKRLVPTN